MNLELCHKMSMIVPSLCVTVQAGAFSTWPESEYVKQNIFDPYLHAQR